MYDVPYVQMRTYEHRSDRHGVVHVCIYIRTEAFVIGVRNIRCGCRPQDTHHVLDLRTSAVTCLQCVVLT